MEVTFLGHSGFWLQGKTGSVIIDPYLSGNPLAVHKPEDINADLVLLTHGHGDHLGDGIQIALQSGATIIAIAELARHCKAKGAKVHGMNLGGSYDFDLAKVKMTIAFHSGGSFDIPAVYLGSPCGFVISIDDKVIYHAGDTALFSDMQLIGEGFHPDLALLPIGDNFTMGPQDAATAVNFIKPKLVVPMHYDTFDVIKQDPGKFKSDVEKKSEARVVVLQPGQSLEL